MINTKQVAGSGDKQSCLNQIATWLWGKRRGDGRLPLGRPSTQPSDAAKFVTGGATAKRLKSTQASDLVAPPAPREIRTSIAAAPMMAARQGAIETKGIGRSTGRDEDLRPTARNEMPGRDVPDGHSRKHPSHRVMAAFSRA
jgi:hypothetical protein